MARMEEIMAGLYGDVEARGAQGLGRVAPGVDDPRRRRAGRDSGFAGSVGGPVSLMDILPHLQGLRGYDYSGPNLRGLADLLPGMQRFEAQGPARRHLERQGGDFSLPPGLAGMQDLPPGIDTRNPLGGPNVAPGNVDTGLALGQPPGIPAHARGQAQIPHTQGWRNVAPGFSAAASLGYGTPEFEDRIRGFGPGGRPSAIAGGADTGGAVKPGAGGGAAASGGGAGKSVGGGAAPKAGGPVEAPSTAGGGGGVGKPGASATAGGAGGPGSPKQPSTKQPGAKQIAAKKTGGPGAAGGPSTKKTGGTSSPGARFKSAEGPRQGGQGKPPKPGGKTSVKQAVSGTLNQVGAAIGDVFSGSVPKPAPKTSGGPVAQKNATGSGAPAPKATVQNTTVATKPGKTKPKTTAAAGILKSK